MKVFISIILVVIISLSSGCALVKDNPQIARSILSLGLRVAVYKIAQQNPGIQPYLMVVGQALQEPMESISPQALQKRFEIVIRNNVSDPVYASALTDVKNLIVGFYAQVYEEHYDQMNASKFIELIQAFGDGIRFGFNPTSPQSVDFFHYTSSVIIEVR